MFNLYANVYSVRSKRSHLIGCLEFLYSLIPQEGILLKVKEKTLVYQSKAKLSVRSFAAVIQQNMDHTQDFIVENLPSFKNKQKPVWLIRSLNEL